jgi:hypothetical protein
MAGGVDAANLGRIVIGPLAGQRRRADDGEAGGNAEPRVQVEDLVRVRELQRSPPARPAQTRTIRAPLGVVIPEEH